VVAAANDDANAGAAARDATTSHQSKLKLYFHYGCSAVRCNSERSQRSAAVVEMHLNDGPH